MYCNNQINHIIKQGDTFYLLARHYHTTADRLIALNPHKNPYNLQIGDTLIICPGPTYPVHPTPPPTTCPNTPTPPIGQIPHPPTHPVPPIGIIPRPPITMPTPPTCPNTPTPPIGEIPYPPIYPVPPIGEIRPPHPPVHPPVHPIPPIGEVRPPRPPVHPIPPIGQIPHPPEYDGAVWQMRKAWLEHVYWTRMVLISISDRLKDKAATVDRLMKNPADMARVFEGRFGKEAARIIEGLFKEHLQIGGELITALSEGRSANANRLNAEWYQNADRIAQYFARLDGALYPLEETRRHMYRHLDITKRQVTNRLLGHHGNEIEAFDQGQDEAMMMADYFSRF